MGKKTTKTDIYQKVTDQIIATVENGLEGYFKLPWHHNSAVPQNARTGNFYNGVNVPLLWVHQIHSQYVSGQWATYKQWAEFGAQVKKGEKGAPPATAKHPASGSGRQSFAFAQRSRNAF